MEKSGERPYSWVNKFFGHYSELHNADVDVTNNSIFGAKIDFMRNNRLNAGYQYLRDGTIVEKKLTKILISPEAHDHSEGALDLVVIFIGTNDINALGVMKRHPPEAYVRIAGEIASFVREVHQFFLNRNPDANGNVFAIVPRSGAPNSHDLDNVLFDNVRRQVETLNAQAGPGIGKRVRCMQTPEEFYDVTLKMDYTSKKNKFRSMMLSDSRCLKRYKP